MRIKTLKSLEQLLFFTKENLRLLEKNENTLSSNLRYWKKNGTVIQIKKGKYILKSQFDRVENKDDYMEFIANKLYEPSYISGEYVMDKFNLLTEAVYGISCVTTKKTKLFINPLGQFKYYSLTPRLFTGYEVKKFSSATIRLAKKSKALFDFLYLRFHKNAPISKIAVEELRLNWENLSKNEFEEVKKYSKVAGNKRVIGLINLIGKMYYD